MSRRRNLAPLVQYKEHEQRFNELASEHRQLQARINQFIMQVGLTNELDYLQHSVSVDASKLGPFANKIKKQWLKSIQQLTGKSARTITSATIGSEISITPEERKWYSIQEEAHNRSLSNARYRVISQGLMIGQDVIEHAVVARTSDS